MCYKTDGGSVELLNVWKDVQVQTSDGEEARAIGDLHSPEETFSTIASAAEYIGGGEIVR